MELISIDHINKEYLRYGTLRNVRKWLQARGITVIKMGKRYYVAKEDMDNVVIEMLGKTKAAGPKEDQKKRNTTVKEQGIGMELLHKISEV